MDTTKTCTRCHEVLPLERFVRRANRRDGFQPWCKACHAARMRAYTAKRHEREPEYRSVPGIRRYGLTLDDYKELLSAQAGVCAICGKPPAGKQRLCVDHDHRTGQVRGLLCRKCNSALAMTDDTIEYLRKLIAYLAAR